MSLAHMLSSDVQIKSFKPLGATPQLHEVAERLQLVLKQLSCPSYFDKIALRLKTEPTKKERAFLEENSDDHIDVRTGRPLNGEYADRKLIVSLYRPNWHALEWITYQPWRLNSLEVAVDFIMREMEPVWWFRGVLDQRFVHPRHGSHKTNFWNAGTYTGQRRAGHAYVYYGDRPCRLTNEPHCLHLEGRHQGVAELRRIGIHSAADLLDLDFVRYWQANLLLRDIDFEALGRHRANVRNGRKRRQPIISRYFKYNIDYAAGCTFFRAHALHEGRVEHENLRCYTMQTFADKHGLTGPFWHKLSLLDIIDVRKARHLFKDVIYVSPSYGS